MDDTIELTIEGLVSEDGHVRLSDFLSQLSALRNALQQMEGLAGSGKQAYYRVVALRHDSPATVVLERVALRQRAFTRSAIPALLGAVQEIASGEVINPDRKLLASIKALSKPVGKTVRSTRVRWGDLVEHFTPDLNIKVQSLLAPESTAMGSIAGMLERINFHASANRFHVYPLLGPKRVACLFPARLTDLAEQAVNRYVTVRGELRYRSGAKFPHEVDVSSIEVMPPEEDLPRLSELRGDAPDATSGLSAEEFVWKVRDEW